MKMLIPFRCFAQTIGYLVREKVEDILGRVPFLGIELCVATLIARNGNELPVLYVEYLAPEASGGSCLTGAVLTARTLRTRISISIHHLFSS